MTFESRHGDDLVLWAVFERAADPPVSPALTPLEHSHLPPEHPDLLEAFRLLGLTWEGKLDADLPEGVSTPDPSLPTTAPTTGGTGGVRTAGR